MCLRFSRSYSANGAKGKSGKLTRRDPHGQLSHWEFTLLLLAWKPLTMETIAKPATLTSILQQRCPRCRMGRIFHYSIFRGLPKMCDRCSICGLKFEREPGYFLGAMYFSFALGVLIMAPIAVLLWFLTGWWITKVIAIRMVRFKCFRTRQQLWAHSLSRMAAKWAAGTTSEGPASGTLTLGSRRHSFCHGRNHTN